MRIGEGFQTAVGFLLVRRSQTILSSMRAIILFEGVYLSVVTFPAVAGQLIT